MLHRVQCLLFLVLSALVAAQEPQRPVQAAQPEPAEVRLPHQAEVRKALIIEPGEYECWALLDRVADSLHRSYVPGESFEKSRPVAPLVIRFPLRIEDGRLEAFASQLLLHANCFAVPIEGNDRSGVWRILRFDGQRRQEYYETARYVDSEQVAALGDDATCVITTFAMHDASALAFVSSMRQMFSGNGGAMLMLSASGDGNLVTAIGPANRIAAILSVAKQYAAHADHPDPSLAANRMQQLEARIAALEAKLADSAAKTSKN